MEWLQTLSATVVGAIIAVVGALVLERSRREHETQMRHDQWKEDERVRRAENLRETCTELFGALEQFSWSENDYGEPPSESTFRLVMELQRLAPRITVDAPEETRAVFVELQRTVLRLHAASSMAENGPEDGPWRKEADRLYELANSQISRITTIARNDLGHL